MGEKKLLLIIDNLAKGGAEVLLVGTLPELSIRYEIILVTLTEECDFNKKEIPCEKKYTLGFSYKLSIFSCVLKLKKIIKACQPSLIHSHLFYSSLIARMACPSNIPLIYSLHNEMSKDVFNNSKTLTFIEKKTIKKKHSVIAVSDGVLSDYENTIRKSNRSFVLKNFISDIYFQENIRERDFNNLQTIKLVAVGNIKNQKNYIYLIKAFEHLQNYNISLDIYGQGNEKDFKALKDEISKNKLPIILKGSSNRINELLPHYDMYVMCPKFEGFAIATVEAMALGLPLLLSDLPVLREVTFNNALFFDVENPISIVNLIKEIFGNKHDLNKLSRDGIEISKKYSKETHLKNLFTIYDSVLQSF
jgi:L-malate glycosyltransferase